jgi:hypothetical protein
MKTFVPFKQSLLKFVLFVSVTASSVLTQAQSSGNIDLNFANSTLQSGTAGANNAVYRFPDVNSTMDARVKITGRSAASVVLTNIDVTSTGFNKAFQPQISNGSVGSNANWWMEFEVKFVNKGTSTPANISHAYVTGLDIDGNDDHLKEWLAFYGSSSYVVENNTKLTVSLVTGILAQLNLIGQKFLGCYEDHSGIDTSDTQLMTTHQYLNTNTITMRIGGSTNGSNTSNTDRMYAVWFKNFTYSTLPVKLASFTATLNKNNTNADLKWTTASEINVSHFVIERSTDGKDFSDAGIVFAAGNAADNTNYSFSDNLTHVQSGIVYYRLVSIDIDGKGQYSETRIIRISKQTGNAINIVAFPNPVINEVRISIPGEWQNKKVTYEIFNANGQVAQKMETGSSSQTETVSMRTLSPGFYIVRVSCDGQTAQQKIIKH